MGPEVEQKRWREDKRILQNSPTHRKKSSTKQQTHRQCLTVRRQTSSSCSTHILQHTLSMSEGMSFDERHGQGSQCSACMYKTKDERIFSLSFWGIACYGRCLRKGLGHLGWNPNIGMIIPQLSCWCLVHISPQNSTEVLINTEQMMMLDDISRNSYLNVPVQFKRFKLMVLQYCFIHIFCSTYHYGSKINEQRSCLEKQDRKHPILTRIWPLSPSMRTFQEMINLTLEEWFPSKQDFLPDKSTFQHSKWQLQ